MRNKTKILLQCDEELDSLEREFLGIGMTLNDAIREGIEDLKKSRLRRAKKISPKVGVV